MLEKLYQAQFKLHGELTSLEKWRDQPILIVNTATKCGLASQFSGLESIHQKYKDKGLKVLGFPCNQFANQEPETNDTMAQVCQVNFGVTFDLAEKINVNGDTAHPLYQALTTLAPGALGSKPIKWNFTKFLITVDGRVNRYAPTTAPEKLIPDIEEALAG